MTAFNAFQIFNMPVSFKIDEAELGQKYFQIQKMVHPDRFASASEAEKRNAQQWSTRLNDAYSVLKDPIQRAKLVCALLGS
ncbi:Fe-S protein assembly co-chaperone HscB, partial [Turicimonas muris]